MTSSCNQPSLRRYAMNLHLAVSWTREGMRALLSITCCSKHHGVGNQSVIDDIRRRFINLIHELCHCRHRVLGSGLYLQLVTSVSSINLVAVQVIVNRGLVLDDMTFNTVRDFTLFHNFAITPAWNMLHVRTTVNDLAI